MMVGVEIRELVEQIAFIGIFDVLLQGQHSLGLGELEDLELHAQQFDIIVLLVR